MSRGAIAGRLGRVEGLLLRGDGPAPFAEFARKPLEYVRRVLKADVTPRQAEILAALAEPPYFVLASSGNSVGKTHAAALACSWWFDSHEKSLVLTSAPTERQVEGLLWRELRNVRRRAGLGGFAGPKVCRLESGGRLAVGLTARDPAAFQGWHAEHVLVVFDECEGVGGDFWDAAFSMVGGSAYAFLGLYNPLSAASRVAEEERKPGRKLITVSALEHPNVAAEERGNPPPVPSAIRLARLRELVRDWFERIDPGDFDPEQHDVRFDALGVGEPQCWRPGLAGCARVLGVRHTSGFEEVWSAALWSQVEQCRHEIKPEWPLQLGCDVARFGDDDTDIHARRGLCAVHHESHNGWPLTRTAGRLKQLCQELDRPRWMRPDQVPVLIDATGLGQGLLDLAGGYNFIGINSSARVAVRPGQPERYGNTRSHLWFRARNAARGEQPDGSRKCLMDLSRLPQAVRDELRRQLLGVKYHLDMAGRLVVESKDETKKRLRRSPDSADSLNLGWFSAGQAGDRVTGRV